MAVYTIAQYRVRSSGVDKVKRAIEEVAKPSPFTGGLLNRRTFVTGLSSVCSLVMLPGGFESSEHKSALEQRIRSQMDLGVSNGLTVGAVMMVVQRNKVLALEAAGYSNLDTKKPLHTDAIFDIRSISAGLGWQVLRDYFTPHFPGDRFPDESSAIRKLPSC
jgi:hypothetical protein